MNPQHSPVPTDTSKPPDYSSDNKILELVQHFKAVPHAPAIDPQLFPPSPIQTIYNKPVNEQSDE